MTVLMWNHPDAAWLVLANVALAVVVLGCVAWVAFGVCLEIAAWIRKRRNHRRLFVYEGSGLRTGFAHRELN